MHICDVRLRSLPNHLKMRGLRRRGRGCRFPAQAAVAFPFVGLALLAWYGYRALVSKAKR